MKPDAVALDFDHTVFDADRFFWVALRSELPKLGLNERLWEETYERVWPTGYTLTKHLAAIAAASGTPPSQQEELKKVVHDLLARAADWVYPDVTPFLKQCAEAGMPRCLLTFGAPSWQKQKVQSSGLRPFFDHVVYAPTREKKVQFARRLARGYATVLFVDNDPRFLDEVARVVPSARTYWISRVPVPLHADAGSNPPDEYREALIYATTKPEREHVKVRSLREIRLPHTGRRSGA